MTKKDVEELIDFFRDEESMLIFALVHLDGEIRAKIIGIREELYESEKKAKHWRAKLIKKIHPDHCDHPKANEAVAKLNTIYERMIGHGG